MKTNSYETMFFEALRIRRVEERIIEMYPSDKIQSPVHLSIGQEAAAVGVVYGLSDSDWLFINYRGHAYYLARKAPLKAFFAELMGKRTCLSKGKDGSMHLAAPSHGVMGASAIVASTISHAVGAGLAGKIKKQDNIYVSIIGDGALEQGVLHESLNFASLNKIPVLFLCEDNGLAVHSPMTERQAFDIKSLVQAYGIKYARCDDGFDFISVLNETEQTRAYIQDQGAPAFLHVKTMRYKEHVGPGVDPDLDYRDSAELAKWKKQDPLICDVKLIDKFDPEIKAEIDEAVEFALRSPLPSEKDLLTDVN